jgi:hypothetical protein
LNKKKETRSVVAATGSLRELKGILYRKGRKPVSVEEMNAAIVRGALKGNV